MRNSVPSQRTIHEISRLKKVRGPIAEEVAAARSPAICSVFGSVVLGGATLLPTMSGGGLFVEGAR